MYHNAAASALVSSSPSLPSTLAFNERPVCPRARFKVERAMDAIDGKRERERERKRERGGDGETAEVTTTNCATRN